MDITKLPWWIFALCSTFAVGTYNLFLEGSKKIVPNGLIPKHIFICSILTITGLISAIILYIYYVKENKIFLNTFEKHLNPKIYMIIIPAFILTFYMICNTLALSGGGGIAMTIINLNLLVTILGGVILFGDKINTKIIVAGLIALVGFLFASYESSLINK